LVFAEQLLFAYCKWVVQWARVAQCVLPCDQTAAGPVIAPQKA